MTSKQCSTLLTAALLLAPLAAQAATVELYGLIDTGLKFKKIDGQTSTVEMASGQRSGSRWGIEGTEAITDNISVGFALEAGINSDTGEQKDKDKIFDRNSYLFIKHDAYGTIRLGRTGALVGGCNGGMFAGSATPFGITWGLAGSNKTLQGATSRVDNSIMYISPKMAGFTGYAQFSNGTDGEDHSSEANKERYAALGLRYNNGPLDVRAVVDQTLATGHFDEDDQVTAGITANYKFDFARIYATYQWAENVAKFGDKGITQVSLKESESHAFILAATKEISGIDFMTQVGYVVAEDKDGKKYDRTGLTLAASYDLSKNVDIYTAATHVWYGKTFDKPYGKKLDKEYAQTAFELMAGLRYSF